MATDQSPLTVVLSDQEVQTLPEEIRTKVESVLLTRNKELESYKGQLERLKVNSEQRFQQLENQWIKTNTQLDQSNSQAEEQRSQKVKFEDQLAKCKEELDNLKERTDSSFSTHQELSRANQQLEAEKQELLGILERKNKEIQGLNEEWKTMSEKMSVAKAAKAEMQVKLDDVEHEDLSSQYREKRREQEKDMLESQNDWLNNELKNKTDELLIFRKEKSNQILELKSELNDKEDLLKQLQENVGRLTQTSEEQAGKMEEFAAKLKESQDTITRNEEQFDKELEAQHKLAKIYKSSSEESEMRVKELITAVEELQKLLKQATDAQSDLEAHVQELQSNHETESNNLTSKITVMEKELENANDLLAAARRKGMAPLSEKELHSLSPTASATSSFIKSGMTLTQMYTEYMKASDELQLEKQESQRLNQYLDQILQEIEEKAPILQQQREDYENALETTNQLSVKLDAALLESEQQRIAADEAERMTGHLSREKNRLKQQCGDLAQQVRSLLREVEEVRGGPIQSSEFDMDVSSSSGDVTSSSQIIDRHLVTFKNIEELQKQNEHLLGVVRELSENKEQEEMETLESKTSELKIQLDSALEELEDMRSSRRRQMEMVESLVQQRDMYRVLLVQAGASPPPLSAVSLLQSPVVKTPTGPAAVSVSTQKSPATIKSPTPKKDSSSLGQKEYELALQTLQAEFETYRTERAQNEKILSEQVDAMRKEASDFRVQNAKLSSQLEFASERFKMLQSTAESYKKEIAFVREKNQKLSSEMIKNQQSISMLTQDLMASQEKLNRAEVERQNLKTERNMLKNVEQRLMQESMSLRKEQQSQSLLLTNLQTIQTNLDRSDFETKARLTNQMQGMEREVNMLRRKLDGESDQHKTVLRTWESKVQNLQRQLNNEMDGHQKTRDELSKVKMDLQNMKQQCSTAEAQLVASQIKLESALKELKDQEGKGKDAPDTAMIDAEMRELRQELKVKQNEIIALSSKVMKAEQHAEQFKSISTAVENSLKEQKEASQTFRDTMEKRTQELQQACERLENKLAEVEEERNELKNENAGLADAAAVQTADLRKSVTQLQEELQDATIRCKEAEIQEAVSRQDSQQQSLVAKEAQDKYEREFLLHAADVQQLVTIREQLSAHNQKVSDAEEAEKRIRDELTSSKASWEEQLRIQRDEVQGLQNRCSELEGQNGMLHQQLEALSNQIVETQSARRESTGSLNISFSDENKSTEQLLEVIKFLRREKEIALTRLELVQCEGLRSKQKSQSLERQLTETQRTLGEERDRAQVLAQTTAQHQEVLKKVETLNALTDSNRLLREEKEKLDQQQQQTESKVNQLERDILPLQEQNREISSQLDVLTAEKHALTSEVTRWRQRTNHLIEQCNKADPEEQKKLLQEKEANKKAISDLREETMRYKAEISKLNGLLMNSKNEIAKQNMTMSSVQSKHILELRKSKGEENALRAEVKSKTDEITAKDKEIDEKNKINNQVKRLGRRYKSQYEDTKKQLDEVQAKLTSQQEEASKPNPEMEAKIKALEERLNFLQETVGTHEQSEATLKAQIAEKEEKERKSKSVLNSAKQKIQQLTSEKERNTLENERLRQELGEMQGQLSVIQVSKAQMEKKMESQRQEFLKRINHLEKETKDARDERDRMRSERAAEQLKRETQLAEQESLQQAMMTTPDRASSSREEPPTANIKPLSSPASAVGTAKAIPVSSGPKATASIRPIAVTPSTSSGVSSSTPTTRMATVMPHTIEPTQVNTPDDHEVQTSEPPTVPMVSATPIQAVTPTQQAVPIARTEPMSQEPEPYEDDTPTSGHPLDQSVGPTTSSEPSSSSSVPSSHMVQQSSKRQRDEPTESDDSIMEREIHPPTEKRQRVTGHPIARIQAREETHVQPTVREAERSEAVIPTIAQYFEERQEPATASVHPEQSVPPERKERIVGTVQGERIEPVVASNQVESQQASQSGTEDPQRHRERSAEPQSTGTPDDRDVSPGPEDDQKPTPSHSQDEVEEEVILIDDNDDIPDQVDLHGDGRDDGDEDVDEYDEQEELEGEGFIEDTYNEDDDDQLPYQDEDEEDMEDDDELGEEAMEGESDQGENPMDNDIVEIIDDDVEEHGEASETGTQPFDVTEQPSQAMEAQQSSRGPPQLVVEPPESSQVIVQEVQVAPPVVLGMRRDRLTSLGRHPPSFALGNPFEDVSDDRQVPSTPTLFVPHRSDGFAEAINSPLLVHQRFHFSTPEGEARAPGLAQLETVGDLGMDATHIYLPGGEDEAGGGRSVPTNPLQMLAPVSVVEAGSSFVESTNRPESTVAPTSGDQVLTSSGVSSQKGEDDAGTGVVPGQQRSSTSPSPPTSSEQVVYPKMRSMAPSTATVMPATKEEEDRSTVSGSEEVSHEAAATSRPETSGNQQSGNAQPSSSGDGETKQKKRIVWSTEGPSTSQQAVQPQSSSNAEHVRPTPRLQTATRGGQGRVIRRIPRGKVRGRGHMMSRGGRGGM